MAQWLKKVGDTPLRANGFIIDSFSTNDNKEFNAPSIQAVEQRTDNNIIFGSNFADMAVAGAHDDPSICGWTIAGSDIDQFAEGYGIMINETGTHTLKSPKFTGDYEKVYYNEPVFSLSMQVVQAVFDPSEETREIVVKLENLRYPYNPQSMPVYEDPLGMFEVRMRSISTEGYIEVDFINTSGSFFISWIKFEIGESATAPAEFNKDISTRDSILKAVNDFLLVEKVTVATSAIPPYAMAETGGAKNIAKEGYKALGVVGLKFPNDVTYSSMYTGYLGGSGDMLYYVITNLTASEKTNSFDAYILYQRIF